MQVGSEGRGDSLDERIRKRAHRIWEEEGRPEGRDQAHWDMATELVAIEDNYQATLKPVARDADDPEIAATSAEPPEAANTGELPTLTDEGDQVYPPTRHPDDWGSAGNGASGVGSGGTQTQGPGTQGRSG